MNSKKTVLSELKDLRMRIVREDPLSCEERAAAAETLEKAEQLIRMQKVTINKLSKALREAAILSEMQRNGVN